jgi:hypothetical protein
MDNLPTLCFLLVVGLGALACSDPIPCSDCDDSAAEMEEEVDPTPDLPCEGANLMTDPLNCGSCGNDCLWFAGTEWEAGGCQAGECVGPGWAPCASEAQGSTCSEICAPYDKACVAGGCGGHTALLMSVGGDFDSDCVAPYPYATMQGPCDEPIPYRTDVITNVRCCCD